MTAPQNSGICVSCRSPKAHLSCPLCESEVCSKCVMRPPQGAFQYQTDRPVELGHPHYCQSCFVGQVEPALDRYVEVLQAAREVFVFFVTQKKEIPLNRRSKELLMVQAQEDRDQTILKLAYMAADRGYNSIIQCDVKSVKVRHEGYQRSEWSGKAYPADVDADKMNRYGFD